MRIAKTTLLIGGFSMLVTAIGWWWIVFGQIISYGYLSIGEAALCLGENSGICELAMSLCGAKHPFGIAAYSVNVFWVGLGTLFVSLATISRIAKLEENPPG